MIILHCLLRGSIFVVECVWFQLLCVDLLMRTERGRPWWGVLGSKILRLVSPRHLYGCCLLTDEPEKHTKNSEDALLKKNIFKKIQNRTSYVQLHWYTKLLINRIWEHFVHITCNRHNNYWRSLNLFCKQWKHVDFNTHTCNDDYINVQYSANFVKMNSWQNLSSFCILFLCF